MGGSSSAPSPVKFKTADAETFITMMTWRKMKDWKRSWLICLLFLRMEKCSKKKGGGLGGGETPVPGYTQLACWSQSFAWRRASAYFPG